VKRVGSIDSYQAMRRAFRELTGVEADGAATRARVLAGAGRDIARRERLRRIAVPIAAAAAMASGSVSAALAIVHHWHAPASGMIGSSAGTDASMASFHAADGRAVRVIPFETPATPDRPADSQRRPRTPAPISDAEARAYARAHRAHFADDAPARALDAWDAYLAAFPHGAFAPEAAYNRAICLVRLERRDAAARALRRIAAAPPGSYRRDEALRLLDWLGAPGTK
jgi:TolA-binding protein